MTTEIFFSYNEYRTGGDICEGQEGDAWPNYETSYYNRTYVDAYLEGKGNVGSSMWFDQVACTEDVKVGDTVYLVDVIYSTGDTFGQSEGYHYLVAAFLNRADAEIIQESITDKTYPGYKPWEGYFEALSYVDILTFAIKE